MFQKLQKIWEPLIVAMAINFVICNYNSVLSPTNSLKEVGRGMQLDGDLQKKMSCKYNM